MPADDRPLALLGFNVGVELGQLLIVAAGVLVLFIVGKVIPRSHVAIKLVPAYAIGIIATYWFLERVFL